MADSRTIQVHADFNGLFSEILCLSHDDSCTDADGNSVILSEGLVLTAFDDDIDERGNRDNLIATGVVERAPEWLRSHGSRWVLRIDESGVQHESDLQNRG
jgi:hypothetical protein